VVTTRGPQGGHFIGPSLRRAHEHPARAQGTARSRRDRPPRRRVAPGRAEGRHTSIGRPWFAPRMLASKSREPLEQEADLRLELREQWRLFR
jgi:hypothetical protein